MQQKIRKNCFLQVNQSIISTFMQAVQLAMQCSTPVSGTTYKQFAASLCNLYIILLVLLQLGVPR